MLLVALTACTSSSQTSEERRAEAARADSSAAGYDVGRAANAQPSSGPVAGPSRDSTSDSTRRGAPPASGATVTPPAPQTGPTVSTPASVVSLPPRGGGAATPRDTSGRGVGAGRAGAGGGATTAELPPLDPALEPNYLTYDVAKKTANFQLATGNELGSQVSFNGARRGGRTLTIPVGWRVGIEFTNRDPDLPHSAAVVAGVEPLPEQLPSPAFPQAQTVKIEEGLLEGDSDQMSFVADRAGRYLIACGVQGHAQRGQWILLEVSGTATVPTYR